MTTATTTTRARMGRVESEHGRDKTNTPCDMVLLRRPPVEGGRQTIIQSSLLQGFARHFSAVNHEAGLAYQAAHSSAAKGG